MAQDTSVDTEFSGTTAVVGVITGDKLTVANIGDSRLILGSLDDKGVIRPKEGKTSQNIEHLAHHHTFSTTSQHSCHILRTYIFISPMSYLY